MIRINRPIHGIHRAGLTVIGLTATLALRYSRPGNAEENAFRPAAIETTGVPRFSPQLFERLSQYGDIRSASFSGWSPTGDGILIRTRLGNASQLHRVPTPGGRRQQITFSAEPVRGTFVDHADDGAILYWKSTGGNEQNQVHCWLPDEHCGVRLTDGKSRNSVGPVSRSGKRVVIHSTQRNGRDTDTYLGDCRAGGTMELVLKTDGEYWYCTDWSPDGTSLLMTQYVSANESYLGVVDLATRRLRRIFLPGQQAERGTARTKVSVRFGKFAPEGKSVFVATDLRGEFRQLARLNLASGTLDWLTDDIPWDIESLDVHVDTGRVAFTVNQDGASRLYLLERDGTRRPLRLPQAIVGGLAFSPDGDHLGMTLSRANAPSDAFSIALETGELTRWTFSEMGGLDPDQFLTPSLIHFPTFDDREVPAYYFRPPAAGPEKRVPVIMHIHGGPESQYRPSFSDTIQFLAGELGAAVLAPNVRGSAGYGKTYVALDNAELREDSVRDIGALLDWIAQQPELDASRVLVMGGSYGGYMVLSSLSHYPDRIAAGIDLVGIANFITFLERTKPYRRDLRRAEYGDERDPQMREVFARINPTARADRIRSPLLVVHGKNDPRVPFFEAQQIVERVRSNGVTVWTVYADNEGHGFAKKDNRNYLRGVEVAFIQQFLGISTE